MMFGARRSDGSVSAGGRSRRGLGGRGLGRRGLGRRGAQPVGLRQAEGLAERADVAGGAGDGGEEIAAVGLLQQRVEQAGGGGEFAGATVRPGEGARQARGRGLRRARGGAGGAGAGGGEGAGAPGGVQHGDAGGAALKAGDEQVPQRGRQAGQGLRRGARDVAARAQPDRLGWGCDSSAVGAERGADGGDEPGEPFREICHGGDITNS
jgi:hypothetical protein